MFVEGEKLIPYQALKGRHVNPHHIM